MRARLRALVVVGAAAASACIPALTDNPPRDARSVLPDRFGDVDQTKDLTSAHENDSSNTGRIEWKDYFASSQLRGLIEEALSNNQELNIALQELVIARTEVDARFGELFPKVSAGVGAGIEKVGSDTSQGVADRVNGVAEHLPDFAFGLRASWEVDIWGKLRDATSAADARYRASVEARNFMVTELVAEIARSYYELVALDAQLEIVGRNIKIQEDALDVVRVQKEAAKVTQLAVQRFEAEVFKNRARLFDLQQQRVAVENRINFLVGRPPQPVARDPAALSAAIPMVLNTGMPADLLDNRPDVRRATLELEAAKLDVGVARANFYPALSIDTELGYKAFNLLHLINTPESLVYNLAGNLAAPILNRPAIEAEYKAANARQIGAVLVYERTVLQAFTDVVNQLVRFENLQHSAELSAKQVDILQSSIEVSNVLFSSARADYMEVLLTRREALEAELELVETRQRVWSSTVDLYQALGGGWKTASTPTPPPTTASSTAPPATTTTTPAPAATPAEATPTKTPDAAPTDTAPTEDPAATP